MIAKLLFFLILMMNPGSEVHVQQDGNILTIYIDGQITEIAYSEIK